MITSKRAARITCSMPESIEAKNHRSIHGTTTAIRPVRPVLSREASGDTT